MKIKVVSLNMKHFKGRKSRVDRLVDYLQMVDADVVGLYEVTGRKVYDVMSDRMDTHTWLQSTGRNSQKILVGVRKKNLSVYFSVLSEFNSFNPYLRPGVLATIKTKNGTRIPMLFLHLKSHTTTDGLDARKKQYYSFLKLAKKLPNFIIMGDLNTMGLDYPYGEDIVAERELKFIDGRLKSRNLFRLPKTQDFTWHPNPKSKRYPRSNLDHVIAARNLKFTDFGKGALVRVDGPNAKSTKAEITAYRKYFSDHSSLYFEVNL